MGYEIRYSAFCAALAIGASAISNAAVGQATVRGVLYDDSTGARLRGTVMLVDPSTDAAVVHVRTDSLGQFSIQIPLGTYQLAVVQEGYSSVLSAPIALGEGERLTVRIPVAKEGAPVHRIGVLEHLRPDSARVAGRSSGRVDGATDAGFQARAAAGLGLHYTREDLERTPVSTLGEFLQNVPGLFVVNPSSASTMRVARSAGLLASSKLSAAPPCHLGWFLDGRRIDLRGRSDPLTDSMGALNMEQVAAVEIFRGLSEMPPEFAASDLRCGAVAVWLKH